MSMLGVGIIELMMLLSGGTLMGLPPGDRDELLAHVALSDSVLYMEWSARSQGMAGAPGIDGFAADPEIRAMIADIRRAIQTTVDRETAEGNPEEQILGRALPPLIEAMLVHPGCISVTLDEEAAAEALQGPAAAQLGTAAAMLGLRGRIVINAGDQADDFAEHLTGLLELLPPENRGENLQNVTLPAPVPGFKLTLHRHEKYFLFLIGEESTDKAVEAIKGASGGLAESERFTAAFGKVKSDRPASVTWLDTAGLVNKIAAAMGLQGQMVKAMALMTGLNNIEYVVACTGVTDGQIHGRTFVHTGGKTNGVLSLTQGRAITAKDFERIPADADMVTAFSLNLPAVYTGLRGIVAAADPNSAVAFDQFVEKLEEELGIQLEEEVFAAFGDVWTLHDSPGAGGLWATSAVASLEVKDAEKAYRVFSELMKIVKGNMPGEFGGGFRRRGVYLAEKKFLDRTIYYINTVGDDVPFAPAFCVTNHELLAALHPQALKAHLRFLESEQPRFASRMEEVGPLSAAGEQFSYNYYDARSFYQKIYAFTPYLAQLMFSEIQREGVEIDIFSLPSARAILPYIGDSGSSVVRTEDGILCESRTGLPLPVGGIGASMTMPLFFLMGVSSGRARFGNVSEELAVPPDVEAAPARPKPAQAVPAKVVPRQKKKAVPVPRKVQPAP